MSEEQLLARIQMLESINRGLRASLGREWDAVRTVGILEQRCARLEERLRFHQRYVRPPHDPMNPVPIANLWKISR